MASKGDDAYSLQVKSKVPQPTTHRFLTGKHGDPRSSTVRKWAKAYGITESQMRGDVPIDGVDVGVPASQSLSDSAVKDAAAALTPEQKKILSLMESMDSETRNAWLKISASLAKSAKSVVNDPSHKPQRDRGAIGQGKPIELDNQPRTRTLPNTQALNAATEIPGTSRNDGCATTVRPGK